MITWKECKNILCIRLDNMGDILMSSPAFNALKETLGCRITLLTSSMGQAIASYIPAVDEVLVYDVPWVKTDSTPDANDFANVVGQIREKKFDAAVVFTVFSQNPLPAVMLAYLAGIPRRLAYCRENPYKLLTDWVPDKEPYTYIQHQVRRDLDLVRHIGANTSDDRIKISLDIDDYHSAKQKLIDSGLDISRPWLVCHPGVSEPKREYPIESWTAACRRIVTELGYQVVITGNANDAPMASEIATAIGENVMSVAGLLTIGEFINTVNLAPLVVSVNTAATHIASATGTPVIVLYAMTNPQHTPWKSYGAILPFPVREELKSKNEVLKFVEETYFSDALSEVEPDNLFYTIREVLGKQTIVIPELIVDRETIL